MFDLVTTIGNVALVVTICLFLTGTEICYNIHKSKVIGDISALPFLTAFINCILNFFYGILIRNHQVIIVNVVGFNLEAIYIMFYLFYTQNKKKLIHQILFLLIIITGVGFYGFFYQDNNSKASFSIGCMASLASIVMFGSPLAQIRNIMKTQSTESISFSLCFANFACSSLWAFYGILLGDKFIFVPNIIGSMLGLAQVSLFIKFPSQSLSTRSKFKADDPIM